MDFPTTVVEAIKRQYEATSTCRAFGGCASEAMAPYYVMHLEDNLIEPMAPCHREEYALGAGIELDEKMRALRSSSAMTFNLLGNHRVEVSDPLLAPVGRYEVNYEYQLSTLRSNPNKANLDARLLAEDRSTVVYCEMKMAEWMLGWMKMLRASYLDPARYLIPRCEAQVFIDLFEQLVAGHPNRKGSRKTRFSRFDALQMAKHLLAIYSNLDAEEASSIKLITCIWEVRDTSVLAPYERKYESWLAIERREFSEFARAALPVLALFEKRGFDLVIEYVPFDRFLACLSKTDEQQRKLARYLM
ncbi:PGN_0703 family putative restriction endonuclease [Raoultibacter phocaeensis]|uniref:PGN_0703 family putative restriction endonuclease n=1 Tax=Raoultibacter phocaeensis TaxID=2479841 RepID=UPI001119BF74|nr:hypothetical protein [Raoultibacter phocaeensis]